MNRRNLLKSSAALGFASALPTLAAARLFASSAAGQSQTDKNHPAATSNPLIPPAKGSIPVAFPISDGAEVIDFCGPWEIFADVPKACRRLKVHHTDCPHLPARRLARRARREPKAKRLAACSSYCHRVSSNWRSRVFPALRSVENSWTLADLSRPIEHRDPVAFFRTKAHYRLPTLQSGKLPSLVDAIVCMADTGAIAPTEDDVRLKRRAHWRILACFRHLRQPLR